MSYRLFFYPILALTFLCTGLAQAETSVTTKATFKKLDDYLQNNALDFETAFNATADGNALYRGTGHFIMQQPNALRADTNLQGNTYLVISDGSALTIYNQRQKKYSQTPAQPSLTASFGFFSGELGIDSQILNFMDIVHNVVVGGDSAAVAAAGSEQIDGKSCDKFTITDTSGDETWQAWLRTGGEPLLCKLVYRSVDGPEQINTFRWNPTPQISPQTFVFSPPAGSAKVDVGDLSMVSP